jgi:Integrase core domain
MGKAARHELVHAVRARYNAAPRGDKRRILDEFVALTSYHRKHAIRVLTAAEPAEPRGSPAIPRRYDDEVRQALVTLWEASDRLCGKRLKASLPLLVEALERHGHLALGEHARARLLAISASTIDRLLATTRAAALGRTRRRTPASPLLRKRVPIRTFADWNGPLPGYMEVDLVAHGGPTAAGSFVHTLTLTDIATGWTECVALVVREGALVVEALTRLRAAMPFPLRGIDTDNGSEFINEVLVGYCEQNKIEFTRSRPYRKNDQAWVEQKNGAVVRRLVGYRRLEGLAAAETLARLYAASRLLVNFVQPSFKLKSKTRVGSRVVKKYHAPETPYSRLLATGTMSDDVASRLRALAAALDPIQLLEAIRGLQQRLARLASGEAVGAEPPGGDLDAFVKNLATAWQQGEVRPTHRRPARPPRHWRTRKDAFEEVWPTVRAWLEAKPDGTAKEFLARLQQEHPGTFPEGQLRTLQRRVRAWRATEARRLLLANLDGVGAVHREPATVDP